jgi:hypothetical protein
MTEEEKEIERLHAECDRLRSMHAAACDRIAQQSDALSRTAEGRAALLLEKLRRLTERSGDPTSPATTEFDYVNHRGVAGRRTVALETSVVYWGATQHHSEPQWLFDALDLDRGERRTLAVNDITLDPE